MKILGLYGVSFTRIPPSYLREGEEVTFIEKELPDTEGLEILLPYPKIPNTFLVKINGRPFLVKIKQEEKGNE